ncbi:MAG: hypothetical protein HOW73_36880 [Polyangiaceae bacterium]|nr:hypothetical protein [Polyangiaceae bacterium]
MHQFFQASRLRGTYPFRVTHNFDLEIDEQEGEDLLQTIQAELRRRDRGNAVRVENGVDASVARLCRALHLDPRQADIGGIAHNTIYVPRVDATLSPFMTTLPLQLLSYYVADFKGTDVDQPRNLAKTVTVE